jgi:hypothetical protein
MRDYKGVFIMIKKAVDKLFNKDNEEIEDVSTDEVVLKALCAYRDNLIMSNPVVGDDMVELMLITKAIRNHINKPIKIS